MKKILVACGTGIATSTVVTLKIREALKAKGIDADVQQCKVSEIGSKTGISLIVTTTTYENPNVPVLRSLSFLTGIGIEEDLNKIVEILSKD